MIRGTTKPMLVSRKPLLNSRSFPEQNPGDTSKPSILISFIKIARDIPEPPIFEHVNIPKESMDDFTTVKLKNSFKIFTFDTVNP